MVDIQKTKNADQEWMETLLHSGSFSIPSETILTAPIRILMGRYTLR